MGGCAVRLFCSVAVAPLSVPSEGHVIRGHGGIGGVDSVVVAVVVALVVVAMVVVVAVVVMMIRTRLSEVLRSENWWLKINGMDVGQACFYKEVFSESCDDKFLISYN